MEEEEEEEAHPLLWNGLYSVRANDHLSSWMHSFIFLSLLLLSIDIITKAEVQKRLVRQFVRTIYNNLLRLLQD